MFIDSPGKVDSEVEFVKNVRQILANELPQERSQPPLAWFADSNREFSERMGQVGLLGLGFPEEYGGRKATAVERFLVNEEMCATNAPISAHLVSERQQGPCIIRYGSQYLKDRFLPLFTSGKVAFSVGFSEPDAGSDLASVKTSATKVDGGWLVNGTKVWTTNAHLHDYFAVLLRTSSNADADRHQGLSQFIVDLHAPGVKINPIRFADGEHHFNEVVLSDVFVPDEMVLGEIGMGWTQAVQELSYERSAPDRYMAAYPILEAFVQEFSSINLDSDSALESTGRLVSRFLAIRQMSLALARSLDLGVPPGPSVALIKDVATGWVQEMIETARSCFPMEPDPDSSSTLEAHIARGTVWAPIATIAGGSVEVLRSVAAKGLTGVAERIAESHHDALDNTVVRMLQENSTLSVILDAEKSGWSEDLWNVMAASGLPWIGVPEESGGSGGSFDEALKVIRWCGYFAVPLPISETGFLGGWLLSQAGLKVAGSPISAAVADSRDLLHLKKVDGHFLASGVLHRVPWASHVSAIVALADLDGEKYVLSIPTKKVTILPGRNMAFEPRCQVDFINVPLDQDSLGLAPIGITDFSLQLRGALARATLIAGACQAATDISVDYARNRQAFGVPIAKFQAIQHHLVRAAIETDLVTSAALVASQSLLSTDSTLHISAAKVAAGRAARVVAAESHQVHGAIGMTQEYELHPRTRRIHSWSHEYGSEIEWARRLGAIIGRIPKDELWPTLSAPPASIASEAR